MNKFMSILKKYMNMLVEKFKVAGKHIQSHSNLAKNKIVECYGKYKNAIHTKYNTYKDKNEQNKKVRAEENARKKAEREKIKQEQMAAKQAERERIAKEKAEKQAIEQKKREEMQARKAEESRIKAEQAEKIRAEKQAKREEDARIRAEQNSAKQAELQAKREAKIQQKEAEDKARQTEKQRIKEEKEAQLAEKLKTDKIKEAQAKAKADEKIRQAEAKKAAKDEKNKQKAEAKAAKEKERLAKKRNASRNNKIDKKQAKRLQELETALEHSGDAAEIEQLEQAKTEIKNKKKSTSLDDLLNLSISSKKYLVIEIKEDKTYVAELAVNGSKSIETKRVTILDSVEINTPPDTFVNGHLKNTQRIAIELIKLIASRGLRAKDVIWISDEQNILQRSIEEFPIQKDAKSNLEIVYSRAADLFPVDLDGYILRYKVLKEYSADKNAEEAPVFSATGDLKEMAKAFKKDKNMLADVQVIAFPKEIQELYISLGELCGINTRYIEYSNNGLINLLRREYRDNSALVVEIEDKNTYIYVVHDGDTLYQSKVSIGYSSMLNKLMAYGDKLIGTTPSEIYSNIKKYRMLEDPNGITQAQKEIGFSSDYNIELNSLIDDIRYDIGNIIDKIVYSIADSKSINNTFEIEKVDIICREPDFPDLTDDINSATHLDANIKTNYEWVSSIDDVNINNYIHSIGAALFPINFKSEEKKKENKANNKVMDRVAIGILVVGLVGCAGTYLYLNHQYDKAVQLKIELNQKLEEAHEAEILSKRAQSSISTLRDVKEFIEYSPNTDLAYEIISEFEKITPKTTVFATIIVSDTDMTMTVFTETRYDAIKLLDELEELKYFSAVKTQGIQSVSDSPGINNDALGNYMIVISCEFADEIVDETNTEGSSVDKEG